MPAGTKVEAIYQALLKQGYGKGKAAAIAQSKSGQSLATGEEHEAGLTLFDVKRRHGKPGSVYDSRSASGIRTRFGK